MDIKKYLSKWIAQPLKSCGVFGRQRFRAFYWAYRLWPGLHIRHKEWDFVLEYLPPLHNDDQRVTVLDVGCSRNLLCHEIAGRGYKIIGVDLEPYQDKFPGYFRIDDIRKFHFFCPGRPLPGSADFVTCISVLEHIGDNGRGHWPDQEKALYNMCESLKVGGRLILTCPTVEFAQGHIWHGFTWNEIEKILPVKTKWIESVERAGQLCMVLERTE